MFSSPESSSSEFESSSASSSADDSSSSMCIFLYTVILCTVQAIRLFLGFQVVVNVMKMVINFLM